MTPSNEKLRLDVLLAHRGLVESREVARRMVMAGEVTVYGQVVTKPGLRIRIDADIELKQKPRFVSRGGEKLAAALAHFNIGPQGWVCADVGASTGGFTDCLLKTGAARVYAIDVGYGQLAWTLRQDPRVVVMERVNARYLAALPEPIQLVTMDVSFISVRLLLAVVRSWLMPAGQGVVLVKPQFEAGRGDVGKGGVVREPETHRHVLSSVIADAQSADFHAAGLMPSPIQGPAGNIEFLLWLTTTPPVDVIDLPALVDAIVAQAHAEPTSRGTVPAD